MTQEEGNQINDVLIYHNIQLALYIVLYINIKAGNNFYGKITFFQNCLQLTVEEHAAIYLDYTWRVNEDLCSSDHYPIFIESNNSIVEERVQHWRLHRADWEAFQQSCGESLTISQFENEEGVDDPIALFTAKLHNIADKSIPKTSTVPKKLDKPWFDEGCRKAINKRKKSLQKFKKHPARQNLDGYKKDYAKARRTISEAKRQSWRAYVSTLNNNTSAFAILGKCCAESVARGKIQPSSTLSLIQTQ